MALYDMTNLPKGSDGDGGPLLRTVQPTSFAQEGIQERAHLQAALRDHIGVLDPELFVVAEEFGQFEGVNRRIDLLCVDRSCRLVVVELKRTADGGHMELQALRYAAMVSTMTFAQVVTALAAYRKQRGAEGASEEAARSDLLSWLDDDDDAEPVVSRDVGILLASEDFSQEITTTVLWLNEFHDFDVRCLRLSPYRLHDRLLVDVQPVIPLPEASLYTVRVREKENVTRQATGGSNVDRTKFVIQTPAGVTEPLSKRWAVLRLVQGLSQADVEMAKVSAILPPSKTMKVSGTYVTEDELWEAIQQQFDRPDGNRGRWHLADPIVIDGDTWVIHNNWGTQTRTVFKGLLDIAPPGFAVYEESDVPELPGDPL